jgi:hypothetical protein
LALACAATTAVADVYKIVGSDGRVTYSDRPPVDARSAVVAHTSASMPRMSISALPATSAGASGAAPARAAASAPPANETPTAARAPLAPDLSKALVAVLSGEDHVQSMFDACTGAQPGTYERLADHVRTWRHHNIQLIAQADRILAIGLSPSGREALETTAQSRVDTDLSPILHGPHARLVQWCDLGADQLLDGTLDIAGRADITEPISRWIAP